MGCSARRTERNSRDSTWLYGEAMSSAQQSNAHKGEFMILEFQEYQAQFSAHIRNPKQHKKPAGVIDSRMAVYREIVFNNIFASISACFPVCRQIFGARAWRKLVRHFFSEHGSDTPFFREIPAQFLKHLDTQPVAEHLKQLAHYEWAELHLSTMDVDPSSNEHTEIPPFSMPCDLLNERPVLNPAHLLLAYDYPVHMLTKRHKTAEPDPTHILMYRNDAFDIKFIVLNAITYQLLSMLQQQAISGKQALLEIAQTLNHPQPETIVKFGQQILQDLLEQGAIVSSRKIAKTSPIF